MTPHTAARMYSVKALAEEWECSDQHIYNLISRGELESVDIGHGKAKTRIPIAAVERYIAKHTRRATKGRAA